jgi:hypothetical protein
MSNRDRHRQNLLKLRDAAKSRQQMEAKQRDQKRKLAARNERSNGL